VSTPAEKIKTEQFSAEQGSRLETERTLGPENVQARFAAENHAYISDLIRLADEKAGFFFGVSAAIIYLLFRDSVQKQWLLWLPAHPVRQTIGLLAMCASGLACGLGFRVVTPRLKGGVSGHVFFRAIAQFGSRDSYADEVMRIPDDKLIREKLVHCYDLSHICNRKYRMLALQLWTMIVGLIFSAVYWLSS
jgi:hypothetical protein